MKKLNKQAKSVLNAFVAGALFLNIGSLSLVDLIEKTVVSKILNPAAVAEVKKSLFGDSKVKVIATAYSPTPAQTDSDPYIAASGETVYEGMIAANFLPFGTKVKIPKLFGEQIFIVKDRMNKRFNKAVPLRIDIFFFDYKIAKNFGIKETEIIIINSDSLVETKLSPSV
mgnify:CR=1 FL=1